MPKTKISEFSSTPANNTDIDSINIAEGCAPSGINDAIRELMSQLKDWQSGTSNDPMVIGSSGSLTLNQGTANGVTYLNGSKVVTSGSALTFDGSNLAVPSGVFTIGATVTGRYLDVLNGTADAQRVRISVSGTDGVINVTRSAGTVPNLIFQQDASELMRLTSTGLGIGTSSPADILTLAGGASGSYGLTINNAKVGGGTKAIFQYDATNQIALVGANTTNGLAFQTLTAGSLTTKATLDSSGNLGIGTSSPAVKLHVSGQSRVADSSNAANYMTFGVGANAPYGNASISTTTAGLAIVAEGAGNITFRNNGSEAMRIDTANNLGLGVTPSAWAWPNGSAGALQLQSGAAVSGYNATTYLSQNWYYNAGEKYIANGFATRYEQTTGKHAWYTAASGTAGNAVSWTQAATITADGNFLVGKTAIGFTTNGAEIRANGQINSALATGNDFWNSYNTTAGAYRFYVTSAGTVTATSTTISAISDQRLKENIRDLDAGLDKIMALKPRLYDWKEGKGANIKNARGFIAQEFEEVFPDLIDEWKDPAPEGEAPYKSVRADLIPVLVKAIQELKAEFDAYKASHP